MERKSRVIDQKFAAFCYAIALCVNALLSAIVSLVVKDKGNLYRYLSFLLPQIGYIGVFAYAYFIRYGKRGSDFLHRNDVKPLHYVWALLIGLGVFFFALLPNFYLQKLMTLLGSSATVVLPTFNGPWDYVLCTLLICVLPCVGEEVIFRKAFCDGMREVADYKTILLCGALFSLSHLNLAQTVHQFFIGCLLGYVYVKTKNVTLTMIIHFINNLFALYTEKVTSVEFWQSPVVLGVSMVIGAALLIGGLLPLILSKTNKLDNNKKGKISVITYILIGVLALAWAISVGLSFAG